MISGREEIREWEKECSACKGRKANAAKQIMAPPFHKLDFDCRFERLPRRRWILVVLLSQFKEEEQEGRNVTCAYSPA